MLSLSNLGEFFVKSFNESPISTIIINERQFLFANQSFCDYFQYQEDEVLNLNFDVLKPFNVTEKPHYDVFNDPNLQLKHFIIERYMCKKDGTFLLAELSLIQNEYEGERYMVVFIRDISENKTKNEKLYENEKRLRLALKATNQAIWDWNYLTDETFYSDDYFAMLGYEPDEFEPSYSKWVELVHPDDRDLATYSQQLYIDNKANNYAIDFRLRKKNGSYIWTHTRATILTRDEDGVPLRLIGIVVNIDERKKKDEIIHDQTQKLIEFAFYNSHVLRSPVARALGLLQLIRQESNANYFELVEKTIFEIDEIIRQMNQTLEIKSKSVKELVGGYKKITFVTLDKVSQFVYKRLTEQYNSSLNAYFKDNISELIDQMEKGESLDHIIIVDMQLSNEPPWDQMNEIREKYEAINVFLLTDFISIDHIMKVKEYPFVKGILLKPLTVENIRQWFS